MAVGVNIKSARTFGRSYLADIAFAGFELPEIGAVLTGREIIESLAVGSEVVVRQR